MAGEPLPRRWGERLLFAFSGLDGPTGPGALVGAALPDRPGFAFSSPGDRELWCAGAEAIGPRVVAAASDWVEFAGEAAGEPFRLAYFCLDAHTVVGETSPRHPPRVASRAARATEAEGFAVHVDAAGATLLAVQPEGERLAFAFVRAAGDVRALVSRARAALAADRDALRRAKRSWFAPAAGRPRAELLAKALSVLKAHVCAGRVGSGEWGVGGCGRRWSVPSRGEDGETERGREGERAAQPPNLQPATSNLQPPTSNLQPSTSNLQPKIWPAETAFHAVGWRRVDASLAAELLLAALEVQDADGFLPQWAAPDARAEVAALPLLAWAAERVFEVSEDRAFLREAYPRLVAAAEWVLVHRPFADELGLYSWRAAAEARDASARFARGSGFAAMDLAATLAREWEALARLALALDRPAEAERWRARYQEVFEGTNYHLWDDELGLYLDAEWDGSRRREPLTAASLLPLFAGLAPPARQARLLERLREPGFFWTPLPVAEAPGEAASPARLPLNLLLHEGLLRAGEATLAEELRERSLAAAEQWYERTGCLWERYAAAGERPPAALPDSRAEDPAAAAALAEWLLGG